MTVLRRIMFGGGLDIEAVHPFRKIYYTAPNKISINTNANLIANQYDDTTQNGVMVFSNDVTTIKSNRSNKYEATSVSLPDSVTTIRAYAFAYSSISTLNLGNGVTILEPSSFYSAEIEDLYLPSTAVEIESLGERPTNAHINIVDYDSLFKTNSSYIGMNNYLYINGEEVRNLSIPDHITEVYGDFLAECPNLETIDFNNVTRCLIRIHSCPSLRAFYGKTVSDDNRCVFEQLERLTVVGFAPYGLTEYTIPYNTNGISKYIFLGCNMLNYINLPETITWLGEQCFVACTSLKELRMPPNLYSMGYGVFGGFTGKLYLNKQRVEMGYTQSSSPGYHNWLMSCEAESYHISHDTLSIGSYMFYYTSGVIDCSEVTSVLRISDTSFGTIPKYTFIVPDELYDEWIVAEYWTTYASNIIKKSDWDAQQVTE